METGTYNVCAIVIGITTIAIIGATLGVYWRLLKEAQRTRLDEKMPVLCLRYRSTTDGRIREGKPTAYCDHRILNVGGGPAFITKFYVKSPARDVHGKARFQDGVDFTEHVDNVVGLDAEFHCVGGIFGDETGQFLRDRGTEYVLEYTDIFGRRYRSSMKTLQQSFEMLDGSATTLRPIG